MSGFIIIIAVLLAFAILRSVAAYQINKNMKNNAEKRRKEIINISKRSRGRKHPGSK